MEKFAYVPSTHDGRTIVNYSHSQGERPMESRQNQYKNTWCKISDDLCDHRPHVVTASVCAECGGYFIEETTRVRVVNPTTDQHGIVHESCFLANDDVLERE